MWKCPICDNEHDDSVLICPVDGQAKVQIKPEPAAAQWVCQACHTSNDDAFCKKCGLPKGARPETPPSTVAKEDNAELREAVQQMQIKVNRMRMGVIVCIFVVLCLFAAKYTLTSSLYTVYNNISGINGQIEMACSIVALLFTSSLPIPFLFIKLEISKRNLPFTISLISASALAIYCLIIFFGCYSPNAIMLLIVYLQAMVVFLSHRYVKLVGEMDNLLFRSSL